MILGNARKSSSRPFATAVAGGSPRFTEPTATGTRVPTATPGIRFQRPRTTIAVVTAGLLLGCLACRAVSATPPRVDRAAGPGRLTSPAASLESAPSSPSPAALAASVSSSPAPAALAASVSSSPAPAALAASVSSSPAPAALAASVSSPPPPADDDSLEEFAPAFDPSDWDSVTAAYDTSIRHDRARSITPLYGLRFNKAEGAHLEAGGSLRDLRLRIADLELRAGYDLGRERLMGAARARIALDPKGSWGLEAEALDQVSPFGNHQPYGNTWLTLFAGYDAMQYQHERRLGLALTRRFSEDRRARLGWVRVEQDSLLPVTDAHLFGAGTWMERNEAAERFTGNGLRLHVRRGASYGEETAIEGLITDTELMMFGGKLLHGTREFAHFRADAWFTRLNKQTAAFHLRASGSLATGDAPRQYWPDLGDAAGLRAFPPRGEGTRHFLVGTQRLFLRTEVRSPAATLSNRRVKALRNLGLKLVPFAEVGAVWGLEPLSADSPAGEVPTISEIHEWRDLRAPRRSEVHWDLGFGLRRDVSYSGILSYLEVDLAWPMGADTASPRVSVQFSRDGLD